MVPVFFLFVKYSKESNIKVELKYKLYYLALMSFVLLSYFHTENSTALRDFLILFVLFSVSSLYSGREFYLIYRWYVVFLAFLLFLAMLLLFLLELGGIDRFYWMPDKVDLQETNPFYSRSNRFDFEWSLVFGFLVYAYNDFSSFQRLTLIFLEPTNLAFFSLVPLLISLIDKKTAFRPFIITVFSASFFFAISIYGYASVLFGAIVGLCGIVFFKNRKTYFILLAAFLFLFFFLLFFETQFFSLLFSFLENKSGQIEAKINSGGFFNNLSIDNLFGIRDIEELTNQSSYGSEVMVYRYGIIGATFYAFSFFWFVFLACKWLFEKTVPRNWRFFSFLAIFSSALFTLKSPNSLIFIQPLIAHYVITQIVNTKYPAWQSA